MHKSGPHCLRGLHLHREKAKGAPRSGHLAGEYRHVSFPEQETTVQPYGKRPEKDTVLVYFVTFDLPKLIQAPRMPCVE